MFESYDLPWMRDIVEDAYPDTCDIYKPPNPDTTVRDSAGEISVTFPDDWDKAGEDVGCRVDLSKLHGMEKTGPGVAQSNTANDIAIEHDAVVEAEYRILITASTHNAQLVDKVFDVVTAPQDSFNVERLIQVQIRE